MIRSQQEELQQIVEALEKCSFYTDFIGDYRHVLKDNADFQALKRMAYAERHPEVQPNRVTALTWQELLSMEDEAQRLKTWMIENVSAVSKKLFSEASEVCVLLSHEKNRRLFNLLPNAKTE